MMWCDPLRVYTRTLSIGNIEIYIYDRCLDNGTKSRPDKKKNERNRAATADARAYRILGFSLTTAMRVYTVHCTMNNHIINKKQWRVIDVLIWWINIWCCGQPMQIWLNELYWMYISIFGIDCDHLNNYYCLLSPWIGLATSYYC